jgi:hypothetical protein
METVDLFWPAPVKLIQGFDHREAGQTEPSLGGAISAQYSFLLGKFF